MFSEAERGTNSHTSTCALWLVQLCIQKNSRQRGGIVCLCPCRARALCTFFFNFLESGGGGNHVLPFLNLTSQTSEEFKFSSERPTELAQDCSGDKNTHLLPSQY